ncbi:MAG: hypothetical protein Q8O34_00195 [Rhodocyclaceae bacterium]|nr:hypothetical protein [Rhodocyclaceae bacterium]
MKPKYTSFAAAVLGALILSGATLAVASAKTPLPKPAADQRAHLVLLDAERHLVLEEMRNFLAVLQTITDALPRDDMKEVARAARTMGSGAANEIPPQTVAKLPNEFKMLAGGVHTAFDLIALDAETLGDSRHTVSQVSEMLQKCNACHGIYQIKVTKPVRAKK